MMNVDMQLTIHLQLSIYLHAGCSSGWRTAFICKKNTAFGGGFLFLSLLLVTVNYSGGLTKRWMAWTGGVGW
jgi:hypothetical protein